MKLKLCYWALLASTLLVQGCGGGGNLISNGDKDKNPLAPAAGVEDLSARPRPTATMATITTDESQIYDAAKKPLLLRGIAMQVGEKPSATRIAGIKAIKETGSNVVRLYINEGTTDPDLEAALIKVVEQGLVALITLDSPKLTCSSNTTALNNAVDTLWLKQWLGVIAQDRFQPYIMINIANAWGPENIFNADSYGYQDYLDAYKALISKFRTAGFRLPLVIDAPCGTDFNAFSRDRGRELVAADTAKNIILSVQADGAKWNNTTRTTTAFSNLMETRVPFMVSSFAGSGVGGLSGVDHLDIMEKSAGNPALALDLPWVTDKDSVAYSAAFDAPMALLDGAGVSTNLYLDSRYLEEKPISDADGRLVPKGTLTLSMYVKDIKGNSLRAGSVQAKDLRGYQWNRVAFTLPKNNSEIQAANLMNGSTSFDLNNVAQVGFEVLANGKAAKVAAPIKLDDVEIYPGAPEPTLASQSNFDTTVDGWSDAGWGGLGSITAVNGALALKPSGGSFAIESAGWKSQLVLPKINFKQNVFVTIRLFIPASYANDNLYMSFWGRFGANWDIQPSESVDTSTWKKGEWNDIKLTLKWSEKYNVSTPQSIGFQLGGFSKTDPLLIDSITITQQPGKRTKTVTALQYESKFSKDAETYAQAWDRLSKVEVINGELNITPKWVDVNGLPSDVVVLKEDINSISDIDVSGPVIYKVRIFVPASYAGSDLKFRVFTQDNNWGHDMDFPGRPLTIADFKPGEWTSFEFKTNTFPDGFARTQKLRHFGFRWEGVNGNTDTVKIDDIQLFGNSEVEDSQPLFSTRFSTQAEFDKFVFDFAGGGFTQSAVVNAKVPAWKIAPFGWMATSWFGNTGENEVLNISKAEDKVDLTPRGEDIVNGTFGIKATSAPAGFTAPK